MKLTMKEKTLKMMLEMGKIPTGVSNFEINRMIKIIKKEREMK